MNIRIWWVVVYLLLLTVFHPAALRADEFGRKQFEGHVAGYEKDKSFVKIPESISSFPAEKQAAMCYVLLKKYSKDFGKSEGVKLEAVNGALAVVDQLWEKCPESVTVLNLRLQFALFPGSNITPWFELACPIVLAARTKSKLMNSDRDLAYTFHLWVMHMLKNYNPEKKKNDSVGMDPLVMRSRLIFSRDKKTPTNQDLLMWKTLVCDFADRVSDPDKKKIWESRKARIANEMPYIKGEMKINDAWARMANLCAISLSVKCRDVTSIPKLKEKWQKHTAELIAVEKRKIERQFNPLGLSKETLAEKKRMEKTVITPVNAWPLHRNMVDFYLTKTPVISRDYPMLRQFKDPNEPLLLMADAYYKLHRNDNKAGLGDFNIVIRLAEQNLRKVVQMQPENIPARALLVQSLILQTKTKEAKTFLSKISKDKSGILEVKEARQMLEKNK